MSTIRYKTDITYDDLPVDVHDLLTITYGQNESDTVDIYQEVFHLGTSASDYTLNIGTYQNPKLFIFHDPSNSNDVTIKVNGDSVAWPVKNTAVFSDEITAITGSNADASDTQKILLYVFSQSG